MSVTTMFGGLYKEGIIPHHRIIGTYAVINYSIHLCSLQLSTVQSWTIHLCTLQWSIVLDNSLVLLDIFKNKNKFD